MSNKTDIQNHPFSYGEEKTWREENGYLDFSAHMCAKADRGEYDVPLETVRRRASQTHDKHGNPVNDTNAKRALESRERRGE